MLLLLLPSPAFALVVADTGFGFDCAVPSVQDTIPAANRANVPVDVRLAALLGGEDCDIEAGFTLTLLRQDDESTVDEKAYAYGTVPSPHLLELDPSTDLDPSTAYTLRVTPDEGWGEQTETGFTTGYGRVTGLEGKPKLSVGAASFEEGQLLVEYTVTPAEDPDGVSLILLGDAAGGRDPWVYVPPAYVEAGFRQSWFLAKKPKEVCLTISQVDGSGAATAGDQSCADVKGGGCDSTGAEPAVALVGIAALLAARRASRSGRGGYP